MSPVYNKTNYEFKKNTNLKDLENGMFDFILTSDSNAFSRFLALHIREF